MVAQFQTLSQSMRKLKTLTAKKCKLLIRIKNATRLGRVCKTRLRKENLYGTNTETGSLKGPKPAALKAAITILKSAPRGVSPVKLPSCLVPT